MRRMHLRQCLKRKQLHRTLCNEDGKTEVTSATKKIKLASVLNVSSSDTETDSSVSDQVPVKLKTTGGKIISSKVERDIDQSHDPEHSNSKPTFQVEDNVVPVNIKHELPSWEELIDREYDVGEVIGKGSFGIVHKGKVIAILPALVRFVTDCLCPTNIIDFV